MVGVIYLPQIAELPEELLRRQVPEMEIADWFVEIEDERRWMERILERSVPPALAVHRVLERHGIKPRRRLGMGARDRMPEGSHRGALQSWLPL